MGKLHYLSDVRFCPKSSQITRGLHRNTSGHLLLARSFVHPVLVLSSIMDFKSLSKRMSGLILGKKAVETVGTPEFYLKLATECLDKAQAMTSRKFNYELSHYLTNKLKGAVHSARLCLKSLPSSSDDAPPQHDMTRVLEVLKLLVASAKQVEGFVQGCCKLDAYSLVAIILPNVWDHISLVRFDLELCRTVFGDLSKWGATESTTSNEGEGWSKLAETRASLLTNLKDLCQSRKLDEEGRRLVTFLCKRLERPMQESPHRIYEVDYKCLVQKEQLGKGGTCTVHRGIWLGAQVAMKKFIVSDRPLFDKEVTMLSGLSHPNLLSLLCTSTDDRRHCVIVTELMDEDLYTLIQRRAPFSDLESVHMILQMAEGMLDLHQHDIVHRDLKSNNILVKHVNGEKLESTYVHCKVGDFGLSKTKKTNNASSLQTTNVGTSRWMAPEVIKFKDEHGNVSRKKYDPFKADVYSFAMVSYEILTGRLPFATFGYHQAKEMKEKILLGERPYWPKRGLFYKFVTLVEKCWSNEASARPSFDVICEELRLLKYSLAGEVRVVSQTNQLFEHWHDIVEGIKAKYPQQLSTMNKHHKHQEVELAHKLMSIDEVQHFLRQAGLESCTLIVGVDFTNSNKWTGKHSFGGRSLHTIGTEANPYEKALSIVGRTLSAFDHQNLIPCFGFGDSTTHDRCVFSFHLDQRPCAGFEEALVRYQTITPYIRLAGPTSFGPIIDAAVDVVEESGGKHHVLAIISDGQVTRDPSEPDYQLSFQERRTIDAIVNASFYSLSIVLIGVGDGPWGGIRKFVDELPPRVFDNFHFVNFTELMKRDLAPPQNEIKFAIAALAQIPQQYRAAMELTLLGNRTWGKSPGVSLLPPPPKVLQRDSSYVASVEPHHPNQFSRNLSRTRSLRAYVQAVIFVLRIRRLVY